MVRDWLGDTAWTEFVAAHLGKLPFARPGTAMADVSALDWRVLAKVLVADPPPDVLVVAGGKRLDLPAPRTLEEVAALFRRGIGLAMRHTQRCHPRLAEIHAQLEEALGTSQVQLFVTPPGTHGFSWHYDDEDVFIVQTLGVKEYEFRENTIAPQEKARGEVFQRFSEERSPICAATLAPGDFLYIPARWWHMAHCAGGGPSLSISVGVFPRGSALAALPA